MVNFTRKKLVGWCIGGLGGAFLIAGLCAAIHEKGFGSSDAAGWVQSIGVIAAIVGAFQIAQMQHAKERMLDEARRKSEIKDREDADIFARTLAAKNMVQVATQAVGVLAHVVLVARDPTTIYEIGDHRDRLLQLRVMIDGLISASTDHIAVVSALNLSRLMTQTLSDISQIGGTMTELLLSRCQARSLEATDLVSRLCELQTRLVELCQKRGISLDSRDFK